MCWPKAAVAQGSLRYSHLIYIFSAKKSIRNGKVWPIKCAIIVITSLELVNDMKLSDEILHELIAEYAPGSQGLLLTGSFARGDATEHSDVDLWRIVQEPPRTESQRYQLFIRGNYLVSLSQATLEEKEADLCKPEAAIWIVPAIRQAQVLYDPHSALSALQAKADGFIWEPLQQSANAYASEELMGYAEEVHKVINGLARQDDLLVVYALMALSYALPKIIAVQRGILIPTENVLFSQVYQEMGQSSNWCELHQKTLGLVKNDQQPLARGKASLALYQNTVERLTPWILPQHAAVIESTLRLIEKILLQY